jgi:hypothetical protein
LCLKRLGEKRLSLGGICRSGGRRIDGGNELVDVRRIGRLFFPRQFVSQRSHEAGGVVLDQLQHGADRNTKRERQLCLGLATRRIGRGILRRLQRLQVPLHLHDA